MSISVIKKRTLFSTLLLPVIYLFITSCVSSPPVWYLNRTVSPGFIEGMGEGETKDKAKTESLREIAEQVEIRVSAKTIIAEQEVEGESSLLFEQNIETATDIVLTGAVKIVEEKRGGLYYVLYRYDNRPLRVRVLEAARNGEITSLSSGKESPFQKSLLFNSFLTENKVPGSFLLSRENKLWSVSVGNRSFALSGREFTENFFFSGGKGKIALVQGSLNGSVLIGQPSDTLREGQSFSLKIKPPATGFLTLFYIDNAGIVISLLENEPVIEGESFLYPDPYIYPNGLVAEPATGFNSSTDMLLGLFSQESFVNLSRFGKVSENTVESSNEGLYAYGRLLEALKEEESGVVWCSKIIHVSGNRP
ncbi:MAG: LPP20 family lipoprotein [Spirochaetia bacterium]|jgi:hypothetical protein|nr:LPP20 family lipoprotein [Spirochaetia bacterium]